ncbi:peptidoglycan-binding protein [Arthrobacter sp. 35W]|uniref:peptidoglycan-binding protein n=1 Tax=Arthrobacter sp. 35W TaxID=1132441 RepID=UPI00040CA370|nr:peptidoglycan-binding protein [Arthrobacter sp. 35W]
MPAFDLDMSNPFPSGYTQTYGGPNQGGHVPPEWYIQYGMDLGAVGGTEIHAAFDGHVTKLDTTNVGLSTGKVYGAQLFMRSNNDGMGAFYTHFYDVAAGLAPGAQVMRGQVLGRVVAAPGSPHLHLALVEITNGVYRGVDLYSTFLSTANTADVFTVTFHQDGATAPSTGGGGGGGGGGGLGAFGTLSSVYEIQGALIALGYNPGVQDGISGPKTTAAVRAFQSDNGLAADGIVGPMTRAALAAALAAAGLV